MNRTTHNLLGAASGLGLGLALGGPWWHPVVAAGLASITSDGPTSPDGDQYKAWKRLDRWVPDELLGHGGPLQHRGISHWWGLPVLAAVLVAAVVPQGLQWVGAALVTGWASHLAGDFIFGKADPWSGRGPGIPVWPWWGHVGLGGKSGGRVERWLAAPAIAGGLAWMAWAGLAGQAFAVVR